MMTVTDNAALALELQTLMSQLADLATRDTQDPVPKLEQAFAALVGRRFAVAVANETCGLFLSLRALGIGPGDEVIACANAPLSVACAIHTNGARAVLVDSDASGCLDVRLAEAALSPRTRAIVVHHRYGAMTDIEGLRQLAVDHQLPLIEETSEALGAHRDDHAAGSLGLITHWAIEAHPGTALWSQASVLATDSEGLARKLQLMRHQGRLRDQVSAFFAFDHRLSPLHAHVAHHHLAQSAEQQEQRQCFVKACRSVLQDHPRIQLLRPVPGLYSVPSVIPLLCAERDLLAERLLAEGVHVAFPERPLHLHPAAAPLGYLPETFLNAERFAQEALLLPCASPLGDKKLRSLCDALARFPHQ